MPHQLLLNQLYVVPRFVEVDLMKVVHHSKYLIWFEESRFNFLKNVLDISIKELQELELFMPVIDCCTKYKRPVLWDMPVIVDTKLEISKKASFNFFYTIIGYNDKKVYAEGKTTHVFIDHKFNLKLNTPKLLTERIGLKINTVKYAFI
jgi:acyl-CoA thioester hydrolase